MSRSIEADPYFIAESIALIALAPRAKSRGELLAHLKRRGTADEVAKAVLYRLQERGLINDEEFARAWSESRQRAKKLSKRVIATELRSKGIDPETIEIVTAEIDEDDEYENALALAMRKASSLSRLDPEVAHRRLSSALARRGFSFSIISRVAREVLP